MLISKYLLDIFISLPSFRLLCGRSSPDTTVTHFLKNPFPDVKKNVLNCSVIDNVVYPYFNSNAIVSEIQPLPLAYKRLLNKLYVNEVFLRGQNLKTSTILLNFIVLY